MRKVFSTDDVHPRDRFDYWMSAVRQNIVNNDAEKVRRGSFNAELHSASIGAIKLDRIRSSAVAVHHTSRHVAQISSDAVFVFAPLAGRKRIEQLGRQVCLGPGDFALVDPTLPIEGRFSDDCELLVLSIERQQLESRLGNVRALTTRPVSSTTPEGRLACGYLAMLPSYASGLCAAAERSAEAHVLDLIALSLQKATTGEVPRRSFAKSAVTTRLRAEIEARLPDLSLHPETVAGAAGVSLRYANAVLADENTSLTQLIQTRRLERCREALEDPEQDHRTVSEIARGWGFLDMTHFGRRFRSAYNMLPSEFRQAARLRSRPLAN